MQSISAVLPAYNEEANIARTARAVAEVMERLGIQYEVIVVDDGSRDRTADVTRELAAENPNIRLVQHKTNQGYGSALATGFGAATKEFIFMTDGDAQFDVSEITKLLPLLDEADLALGYRSPRRDPFIRKANAFGWNVLGTLLFGYVARDVDCAFKLFRRSVLDVVQVESRGATYSLEFLVRARRNGFRIREVPVKHLPRVAGRQTGARLDVIVRAFRELIAFWSRLRREEKGKQWSKEPRAE